MALGSLAGHTFSVPSMSSLEAVFRGGDGGTAADGGGLPAAAGRAVSSNDVEGDRGSGLDKEEEKKEEEEGRNFAGVAGSWGAGETEEGAEEGKDRPQAPPSSTTAGGALPTVRRPRSDGPPYRVLFLSADTGGGHRASAESLGARIAARWPGSTYELLDTFTADDIYPYRLLVESYATMSGRHPWQWRIVYHASNGAVSREIVKRHLCYLSLAKIKDRIRGIDPDFVVCVHPGMVYNHLRACRELSSELGRRIPFFVVVTDLGSGHGSWFEPGVDRTYLASDWMERAALGAGIAPSRIVRSGLPIRRDFSVASGGYGGRSRNTPAGRRHQRRVRESLGVGCDDGENESVDDDDVDRGRRRHHYVVLLMAGGEGVGSLEENAAQLYRALRDAGLRATVCVVCGKNAALREALESKDWEATALMAGTGGCAAAVRRTAHAWAWGGAPAGGRHVRVPTEAPVSRPSTPPSGTRFSLLRTRIRKELEECQRDWPYLTRARADASSESPSLYGDLGRVEDEGEEGNFGHGAGAVAESVKRRGVFGDGHSGFDSAPRSSVSASSTSSSIQGRDGTEGSGPPPPPASAGPVPGPGAGREGGERAPAAPNPPGAHSSSSPPSVKVVPLGFVTRMAEYMVAADVLVSKAGPGTIAEAAALGLPVLLTNFLPGQEAGNVDYVVDNGFGRYERRPGEIARIVAGWLLDDDARRRRGGTGDDDDAPPSKLVELSENAARRGNPDAADEIVRDICSAARVAFDDDNNGGGRL